MAQDTFDSPCTRAYVSSILLWNERAGPSPSVLCRERGLPLSRARVCCPALRAGGRTRRCVAPHRVGGHRVRALAPSVAGVREAGPLRPPIAAHLGSGARRDECVLLR